MEQLTEQQYNSLVSIIYDSIMSSDVLDMEAMGEAKEEAERIVNEWADVNGISISHF